DYVTNQKNIRIPATFNVMNEIAHPGAPPPFNKPGPEIKKLKVVKDMDDLGDECCDAKWPGATCKKPPKQSKTCDNMAMVADLFEKNYAKYASMRTDPIKLTRDQMLANIYGFVPFVACPGPNGTFINIANELKDTLKTKEEYRKVNNAYVDLQYHSPQDPNKPTDADTFGVFNRYTQLIHDAKYLRVGEYAFSIDDAAGNMLEVGDG